MSEDLGFSYRVRKSGEVSIERNGQEVTILRGESATSFLRKVSYVDPQQLMARATGKYKRGNERKS